MRGCGVENVRRLAVPQIGHEPSPVAPAPVSYYWARVVLSRAAIARVQGHQRKLREEESARERQFGVIVKNWRRSPDKHRRVLVARIAPKPIRHAQRCV